MKAYSPFILIPLAVGGAIMVSPWLSGSFVPRLDSISVQQLALPPGSKEVKATSDSKVISSLRLEALMPSNMLERVSPPPAMPVHRTAVERYRLSSVLLSPEKRSAIINGEVKVEGGMLDEYRIRKISKDSITLKGPNGIEKVSLDSIESTQLFRAAKTENNKLSFTMPAKLPQTPVPSDELERQFRHLLENFSH